MRERATDDDLRAALTWLVEHQWSIDPSSYTTDRPKLVRVHYDMKRIEELLRVGSESTCSGMVALVTVSPQGRARVKSVRGLGECEVAKEYFARCVESGYYLPRIENGLYKEAPFAVVLHLVLQ